MPVARALTALSRETELLLLLLFGVQYKTVVCFSRAGRQRFHMILRSKGARIR
jgi:hypothetical protein